MKEKRIIDASENYVEFDNYLREKKVTSVFLVCGKSIEFLNIYSYFSTLEERMGIRVVRFSGFQPNPSYESVEDGLKVFLAERCDMIVAVGGGSAMDVAKCIKLFSNMDHSRNYLEQTVIPNTIPFLAVPTTAGTGSEETRFAVIYYNGEKQSVSDYSCIPEKVLIDASVLKSLPIYQKKVTMLDAFGHAIESFWSVHSTAESKEYAGDAIRLILQYKDSYLRNEEVGNAQMMKASNLAGKAINITQTTAGHAMCYKLTGLYGIAHGHAVGLCIRELWPYMLKNTDKCIDARGKEYLATVFEEIAKVMGSDTPGQAIQCYHDFMKELHLDTPKASKEDIAILKKSVNLERLKNNPVMLNEQTIETLYCRILTVD